MLCCPADKVSEEPEFRYYQEPVTGQYIPVAGFFRERLPLNLIVMPEKVEIPNNFGQRLWRYLHLPPNAVHLSNMATN